MLSLGGVTSVGVVCKCRSMTQEKEKRERGIEITARAMCWRRKRERERTRGDLIYALKSSVYLSPPIRASVGFAIG